MKVYRIAHPNYSHDLSGTGGFLVSGRWHSKGYHVIYTAENSSLSILEYLAHTHGIKRILPYQLITLEIPDSCSMTHLTNQHLPKKWRTDIMTTRKMGNQWLDSRNSLALYVPSVINEDNCNILLNPLHEEFGQVKLIESKKITFDKRL